MLNRAYKPLAWNRLIASTMALVLSGALSGCDAKTDNEAQQAVSDPSAQSESATAGNLTGDPAEKVALKTAPKAAQKSAANGEVQARELTIEEISGGWRVKEVRGAKSGSETANMKGAIAEIYPESANWSYKPKGAGALNDFCQEPVAGIVRSTSAQKAVQDRFAVKGERIADRAVPHELMCGGGGKFGNSDGAGTDIALIKPDVMAMTWDDGTVLILEKIDRPAPKENMKPEDYRASDYDRE